MQRESQEEVSEDNLSSVSIDKLQDFNINVADINK